VLPDSALPRRRFMKALVAAPALMPASALGRGGSPPPSDRIVMGAIGVGGMGGGHVRAFLQQPDVRLVAVCDVRTSARLKSKAAADAHYGDQACAVYNDFRELLSRADIDAVMIATPDHWHVLVGLEAARRGKHMYFEKPVGMSVAEAKALRQAVRRSGVVFQFGTQQRSDEGFRFACELARNGRLGQLETIMLGAASYTQVPNQPAQPVPPGLDYEMWLGPAPWVPFTELRCTRQFTLLYDYSLGCIGGAWGVHDADVAQWAADADATGPVEVEGWGEFPADGFYDTAPVWEVEHRYANGVKLLFMDHATALRRAPQFRLINMGVLLVGSSGWVAVSRQGAHTHPESLARTVIGPNEVQLPRSLNHRRNFLDAVRTGARPISHIEAAVRSDTVCHQADIAMRLRRKLRWDPVKEVFVDDAQANRLLSRPMRSPWRLT